MPELSKVAKLRDQAIGHHKSGNLSAAISAYESLLKDNPHDAHCLGLLAMAFQQAGQPDAACAKWLASLALPSEPHVHLGNLNNFIAAAIETGSGTDAETWKSIKVPDWPASRSPVRAEKEMIISLARGLLKLGRREECLRLIDGASRFAAGDLFLARNFADILLEAGEPHKADRHLASVSETGLDNGGELILARAATAHATGQIGKAVELARKAAITLPVYVTKAEPGQQFLIGVLNPAPRTVSAIITARRFHFSNNSPASLAWRYNHVYRFWSVFPEVPNAAAAVSKLPRPHLVLNNWVNAELLSTLGTLDLIAGFADGLHAPVLNHPRNAARVTRQRNAERLSGIPGLLVPRLGRFYNDPDRRPDIVKAIARSFGFPLIIRDTFRQKGKEAEKIVSAEALELHLGNAGARQLYAIEFIDNPVTGGLYRKIRAAVLGDEVIISHVHFGERWNVHRDRDAAKAAEFSVPLAEEAFAEAILFKPEETIGRQGMAALREINARIPLEFYGIDFDILPDGRLVFFEANAAMNIAMTGRKSKELQPIRVRMREAFHRLLEQTANRPA